MLIHEFVFLMECYSIRRKMLPLKKKNRTRRRILCLFMSITVKYANSHGNTFILNQLFSLSHIKSSGTNKKMRQERQTNEYLLHKFIYQFTKID